MTELKRKTILLPGGMGYIGSHTIVCILEATQHDIVVIDDFSNCDHDVADRIFGALQANPNMPHSLENYKSRLEIHEANILNLDRLHQIFELRKTQGRPITSVIHFAAKKSAPESVHFPLLYYENNVVGSMNILKTMEKFPECKQILFSSTAAVYGEQNHCTEQFDCRPITPYGESKLCVEMMLKSMAKRHPEWKVISLRYFNPAGNHASGLIGDWPSADFPTNLFPVIEMVILGWREVFELFGSDWNTSDGTPIRDFIHVVDLAEAHLKAFERFQHMTENYDGFNLGSGTGYTVLEVVKQFEEILGAKLNYRMAGRREGDMECLIASVKKAEEKLHWKTSKTLKQMCESCLSFARKLAAKKGIKTA